MFCNSSVQFYSEIQLYSIGMAVNAIFLFTIAQAASFLNNLNLVSNEIYQYHGIDGYNIARIFQI